MTEGITKSICVFDIPLTLVEEECFTCFIQIYLQPAYQPLSRNTIRSDIQAIFFKPKRK